MAYEAAWMLRPEFRNQICWLAALAKESLRQVAVTSFKLLDVVAVFVRQRRSDSKVLIETGPVGGIPRFGRPSPGRNQRW